VRVRQLRAVALLAVVAVAASAAGVAGSPAVLVAASAVTALWMLLTAAARARVRDLALDLIAAGHGDLRLPEIARERKRLLTGRRRRALASHIDELRALAESAAARRAAPHVALDRRALAALAPELERIARLLTADGARPAGIAKTERMLADGRSVLYGGEVDQVRHELRRIGALLADDSL
jgi:hypothetical protein